VDSAWDTWARGVLRGAAVVSNGPLLDFEVHGSRFMRVN
jgi:hypothetical protein